MFPATCVDSERPPLPRSRSVRVHVRFAGAVRVMHSRTWIETAGGSLVSRSASLSNPAHVTLGGMSVVHPDAVVDASLAAVQLGRYCILGVGCVLRPPELLARNERAAIPMTVGHHVTIGEGSEVFAASIGDHVSVGRGCRVGARSILKDCCEVADGAILPPDSVVPPLVLVRGVPAVAQSGQGLPDCTAQFQTDRAMAAYRLAAGDAGCRYNYKAADVDNEIMRRRSHHAVHAAVPRRDASDATEHGAPPEPSLLRQNRE